jgi:hypothetical protein
LRWEGNIPYKGEMKNTYKSLSEKPVENKHLGSPRNRWKDDIKMYLKETGWEFVMDLLGFI